ncbi:Selenate reductase subunit gamma [Myxococcaceae bacterium]|jgi:hypothetical protein|nr:Selenate reductase subunit gamma [Myxococcaceae bacterium]
MRKTLFALLLVALPAGAEEAPALSGITMVRVGGAGAVLDVEAFAAAPASRIALLPQVAATPRNPAPATSAIEVRALRNDDHAAFLLEWEDDTPDVRATLDGFGDMVALQFPVAAGAPPVPFMGNPGGRVQILQWRADWQTDMERGATTMRELYPNSYAADFHHADHLPAAEAAAYEGAVSLGNPMSVQERKSAVQDLVAEGFGSLTPRATQAASGRGTNDGRRWRVVVTRPLAPAGESAADLAPGTSTNVSFAVWNGSKGEVGARKAWAAWVPIEVPK